MSLIDQLSDLGCDVNDAIGRFMNNTSLYERMLKKLPAAVESSPVMPLIESGDFGTAEANAHTLKGVTGNLSITPLYEGYTDIVNFLRKGDSAKAKEIMEGLLPVQEKIMECINNG